MRELIPSPTQQSSVALVRCAVPDVEELRSYVEQAFLRMTRPQRVPRRPRMRVFASNGTRDDFTSRFLSHSVESGVSLETHLNTLWPAGYCLAVNDISSWSERLQDYVVEKFVTHWISRYGESIGGIDVYAFVGRYDKTPFGIHKDDEDSYVFNLGPGLKKVHLWSRDALVSEFGADALTLPVFDYDKDSESCEVITLKPGDGLLIPRGLYHILESTEYSVMLGIAPYLGSSSSLVQSALLRLCKPIISSGDFIDYGDDSKQLSLLENGFANAVTKLSDADLRNSIRAELILLKSNSFIRGSCVPEEVAFNDFNEYEIPQSYVPMEIEIMGRLHLFCRGHELSFGNSQPVQRILASLRGKGHFSVASLLEEFSGEVSRRAITGLLAALYDCAVIRELRTD